MDDSSLYYLLKKKAEDSSTKDEVMYYEIHEGIEKYTYNDVYELVNKYIEFFNNCNYKDKTLYVMVDNSVKSVALFIAMLKVGVIPILINCENFYSREEALKKDIKSNICSIDFFDATKHGTYELIKKSYFLEMYIKSLNVNLDKLINDKKSKFGILTSGSISGKPKMIIIYEKDLLNKDYDYYNIVNTDYFCTYIPISSISSIVCNILLPLYKNQKIILMRFLDLYALQNKNISLLVPRDILDFFNSIYYDERRQYNFSNIDKMYLSGEINNLGFIKKIRKKMPTLKENVFVNLYGSTEALGIISYCEENNLKPIYINQLALANGDFIYTFDKVNFYKRKFINNTFQDEKINLEYDDFIYFECLPVSENKVDNAIIENNFGEIIYNDKRTGDIGIYVNNQLYIICRKTEVVEIDNKKYYLTAIENLFSKIIGLKAIALKYNNEIIVIVSFILNKNYTTNIKNIIPLIKKSNDLKSKLSYLPLSLPIFVDSGHISKSNAMKKVVKNNLISIIENRNKYYIDDYERCLTNKVQLIINNITGSNIDIIECVENNEFRIKKTNTFNVEQLMLLFNQIDISNIYEKNEYFYFTIADTIMIDIVMRRSWEKLYNIKDLCDVYRKNTIEFYNYINSVDIDKKKCNLVVVGKKTIRDDAIIFRPILIDREENVNINNYDSLNYDVIYFNFYDNKNVKIDDIPTDQEIETKIRNLWKFLNHEYSINYDKDFFIDGIKTEKKRHIVYKKLYRLLTTHDFYVHCETDKHHKIKLFFEKKYNQLIIVLNKKYEYEVYDCRLYFNDFDDYQNDEIIRKDNFLKNEDLLKKMVDNLFVDKDNNPVLIVRNLEDYLIQSNNSNFMFEIIKQDTAKRFLELVEMLKKHEPIIIKVDGKDTLINFSNLKVIYMVVDEELYKEPTIDKCIELGYPKEIVNNVDKITSYFGLVEEYKKSKVKRKELK